MLPRLTAPLLSIASLCLAASSGLAAAPAAAPDAPASFTLKTLTSQMRYSESELIAKPGQTVKLTFENGDDLPHNFVLCKPGTDIVALCMKQMDSPEQALKRNWLPDDPSILAHSRMLNPHESEVLSFTLPDKPGHYPFVCSFPGHAMTMRGIIKAEAPGEGFTQLAFQLYQGAWTRLPDFAALKPHREGSVDSKLIEVRLDDYKNEFGVVFTGKLNAPREGNYTFYLTSDDGARVLIDGKRVAEHDGIHPAGDIREGKVKLAKGEHSYRLEYFQGTGNIQLFAAWEGPGFSPTVLSAWAPEDWQHNTKGKRKKKDDTMGMPLAVAAEPVIYRNFIQDAGERAIGVGYPGQMNVAWSAESMNLALIWRGAFMDAARHWNGRGGGHQPALGFDVAKPSGMVGPALAVLDKPDAAWPSFVKGERFAGYRWLGYHLDAQRYPTFRYTWQDAQIEDRFSTQGDAVKQPTAHHLQRSVRLTATKPLPAGTHWRLLTGNLAPGDKPNTWVLDKKLRIELSSDSTAKPKLRGTGANQDLLLPLAADTQELTLKLSYAWLP